MRQAGAAVPQQGQNAVVWGQMQYRKVTRHSHKRTLHRAWGALPWTRSHATCHNNARGDHALGPLPMPCHNNARGGRALLRRLSTSQVHSQYVPAHHCLSQVHVDARQAEVGRGHDHQPVHHARTHCRRKPCHNTAPVVSYQRARRMPEARHGLADVCNELAEVVAVDTWRLVRLAVAPHVNCHDVVLVLEAVHLVTPAVPGLREPVHHEHKRLVRPAAG
eukprot:353522-Chlamydomonas_euryale.AAC.15